MLNLIRRSWHGPVHIGDLERALVGLGLDGSRDAVVHSSLSAFGHVAGGAPTVIEALRTHTRTLVAPAFTYYTLVWPRSRRAPDWPGAAPEDGPTFRPDLPVSPDIGRVPQTLIGAPGVRRSSHPALSFLAAGPEAARILSAQSLSHPYGPIGALYALDADVLLLGVDHRSNTTVHYGEYLAGRPLLDRYAAAPGGVAHTYFPNCSAAFNALEPHLPGLRAAQVGKAVVSRVSVREVVDATVRLVTENPEALLCGYSACRCQAVRETVRRYGLTPRRDPVIEGQLAGGRGERVPG